MLVCLFLSKSFKFQGLNPVFSRPVLHYEVFKVPLRFSATALLIYSVYRFLSRGFFELFKFFFDLSDRPEQRTATLWLKKAGLVYALFFRARL